MKLKKSAILSVAMIITLFATSVFPVMAIDVQDDGTLNDGVLSEKLEILDGFEEMMIENIVKETINSQIKNGENQQVEIEISVINSKNSSSTFEIDIVNSGDTVKNDLDITLGNTIVAPRYVPCTRSPNGHKLFVDMQEAHAYISSQNICQLYRQQFEECGLCGYYKAGPLVHVNTNTHGSGNCHY